MLIKLLEVPPETKGVVVECGCYLGGSTVNLSLICRAVGRELIVYDSFEGLPVADANEGSPRRSPSGSSRTARRGHRQRRELGAIEVCQFRKGWFAQTLPTHTEPIVLCFLDVDFQMSIHQCLVHLWPHLTTGAISSPTTSRSSTCARSSTPRSSGVVSSIGPHPG